MRGRNAAPPRVLVVDDEPSIRLLCRLNLELDGLEVLEAASVAEARARLDEGDVSVVLLDLHLRGERSLELVDECHAHEPPIPVVMVTGSVELGGRETAGADAVLAKPFEIEELLATVHDLAHEPARR